MDEEADRPIPPVVVPAAAAAQPVLAVAVTSCEEEEEDNESSDDDDDLALPPTARAYAAAVPEDNDLLFNEQADEEDEAYVYKHLRSGVEEAVTVVRRTRTSNLSEPPQQQQTVKMLKPRNSDAVLSCPCCFTIVCMDCQQHERYENQYRAMFVQNIAVRWDLTLQYDSQARMLVATTAEAAAAAAAGASSDSHSSGTHGETKEGLTDNTGTTTTKVDDEEEDGQAETQTVYYTVCCANCQTQVAVLDMTEEVYHFSNCLVSSP